jgi:endonuclease-3
MPGRSQAEGLRAKRSRSAAIVEALHRSRPSPRVELDHTGPFQLLVATILSAQCTDARVNQVTPFLFATYPDAATLARAPIDALERAIKPTGFFRAKARSLKRCAQAMVERHGAQVPRGLEALTRLPGIGRKTANVVLGAGFGIASGIVVDTHMARVAARLGLTRHTDPIKVERDLMELLPSSEWIFFSIAMILHGRYVCQARRPRCSACALRPLCPSGDLEERGVGGRPRIRRRGSGQRSGRKPLADSSVS